jgi:HD-like signal output (HDOD) protein
MNGLYRAFADCGGGKTSVYVLKDLLQENVKLPSPPNIALRLLETLKKDDFSFTDVARVIQSDPALSVKVLRAANSDIFNAGQDDQH